jgi:hypothetical protein
MRYEQPVVTSLSPVQCLVQSASGTGTKGRGSCHDGPPRHTAPGISTGAYELDE